MWGFFILKTFHVLYHQTETRSWCLMQGQEIYLIQKSSRLATKRFHKITKKTGVFLYFIFISLFFASTIPKMIIEREKTITIS